MRERGSWSAKMVKHEEEKKRKKGLLELLWTRQNGVVSFKRNGVVSERTNDRASASHGDDKSFDHTHKRPVVFLLN